MLITAISFYFHTSINPFNLFQESSSLWQINVLDLSCKWSKRFQEIRHFWRFVVFIKSVKYCLLKQPTYIDTLFFIVVYNCVLEILQKILLCFIEQADKVEAHRISYHFHFLPIFLLLMCCLLKHFCSLENLSTYK